MASTTSTGAPSLLPQLALDKSTTVIPWKGRRGSRDPSTMIGLHIKAYSSVTSPNGWCDQHFGKNTWSLNVDEEIEPITLYYDNYYTRCCYPPTMDEHLRTALISIEEGQKVEILEAVTGHRDTEVHWQEQETDDYEVKVAKISWREQYNVSGLRLEGMSRIGYIWGQDNHCGFEDTGKFCDVFWLDYGATYLERPLVESNEERLVRKLKEMFLDLRCSRMTRVEFRRVVERDLPRLSRVGLDV